MRGEEIAYLDQMQQVHYVNVDTYPDGVPMVKHARSTCPVRVLLRPRTAAGFLGGVFWVQSIIEQGVRPPELIVPNVFGGRQDRINPTGDTLFTVKSVAKVINSLGCPRVIVLDPHSEATPAAVDRAAVVSAAESVRFFRSQASGAAKMPFYDAIIAPDAGSTKRAEKVAALFGAPVIQAGKKRDVSTGQLTGFWIDQSMAKEGGLKSALIVDDLCDGGGTFVGLRDILPPELGVDLYVTHGLFTKGTQVVTEKFRNVFCTDSVAAQRPDVNVIMHCEHILRHGDPL